MKRALLTLFLTVLASGCEAEGVCIYDDDPVLGGTCWPETGAKSCADDTFVANGSCPDEGFPVDCVEYLFSGTGADPGVEGTWYAATEEDCVEE